MNKIVATLLFCFTIVSAASQAGPGYILNVKIKNGIENGKAFLRYWSDNGPYLDSTLVTNGKFTIRGALPGVPVIARLYILNEDEKNASAENTCEVWLEQGVTEIVAEKQLRYARYDGSPVQQQFTELQENLLPVHQRSRQLDEAYEKAETEKDDARKDRLLNEEYPALFDLKQGILGSFIKKYPASILSAYKFDDFAGEGQINLGVVETVYSGLDETIKQHPRVKKVAERIAISKRTSPGMEAIEFSQTDTAGRLISLSSFRGKYVLVDFWAGWCVPCRAENPHLTSLYKQYREKGFEILGVSLDGERKRWTNAIISDNLEWQQVSDLQIFDNAVAKMYGINSIPMNILIGPDARIIAWNLRGSVLDKKLTEIFK